MISLTEATRIQEKHILALFSVSHVQAGLFLLRKAFAEKISLPDVLQRIAGFDLKEFKNPFPCFFSSGN